MIIRRTTASVLALLAAMSLCTLTGAATHRSTARLYGSPITRAQAKYQEKMINGHRDQRFRVNVTRAAPMQVLQVRVNGRPVGVVVANFAGVGRLNLRTGGAGPANPIPHNFPRIRTGDCVSVGSSMCGVCFEDDENDEFELSGEVESGGAEFEAEYKEELEDGTLEREFQVEIEDGPADTAFDVFVNDVFFATVTTNSEGEAEVEFGDDDGDPLPPEFPSLQPGDTVRIGDVTITLGIDDDDDDNGNGGGDDDDDDDDDDDC